MHVYGSYATREPSPLPNDPVEALETLRRDGVRLPFAIGLAVGSQEEHTFENTQRILAESHPQLYAAAAQHRSRALLGLMGVVGPYHNEHGERIVTDSERFAPLAAHFLGQVSMLSKDDMDPVALALSYQQKRSFFDRLGPEATTPKAIEALPAPAAEILATDPPELLTSIREAILEKRIRVCGRLRRPHEPVVQVLAEGMIGQGFTARRADGIARRFAIAHSRYLRLATDNAPQFGLRAEHLLPHFRHYLAEAKELEGAGLPQPYRRALHYSPEQIESLYDYWVNEKHLPGWLFGGVANLSILDMDKCLAKLYDQYGPDVRPLKWLTPPVELNRPLGTPDGGQGTSLGELLPDHSIDSQPEDRHMHQLERVARFRFLSELLRELPQNEALAVALVYDLDVTGGALLDIATVAAGVGQSVVELQAYVDSHILPKLNKLDAEGGH